MPVLTTDFSPLYFIGRVNSVHPQFPQNHFCFSTPLPVVSLGTTYTFTNSSGSFTLTEELAYMAFVWYGPPLDFWQSVQWHDIVLSGEPSKVTVTEPQRQDPVYLLVSIDVCSTMGKEYIGDWGKRPLVYIIVFGRCYVSTQRRYFQSVSWSIWVYDIGPMTVCRAEDVPGQF